MCGTCGCGRDPGAVQPSPGPHEHEHGHEHAHEHGHEHAHSHAHGSQAEDDARVVRLERAILADNDRLAERNRGYFTGRGVSAFNLVSSPGAGKTTVLERTVAALSDRMAFRVLEGDQATDRDAARIRAAGARALQINTGTGCHLDAAMVWRALEALDPPPGAVLMIENVGNLVCPALFDLGERAKVLVCSVTEGDDKPLKYPHMFAASQLALLNKMDLLEHVDFDVDAFVEAARRVNPALEVLPVSARTGEGLEAWFDWLEARRAPARSSAP